jgi:hypothetical protein
MKTSESVKKFLAIMKTVECRNIDDFTELMKEQGFAPRTTINYLGALGANNRIVPEKFLQKILSLTLLKGKEKEKSEILDLFKEDKKIKNIEVCFLGKT